MDKKDFTTHEIALLLRVTKTAVRDWVDRGRLKAYRTPGGHRRVFQKDLMNFLNNHNLPIPDELQDYGAGKILIVDDDIRLAKSIKMLIKHEKLNCKIFIAVDGFEAGEMFNAYNPEIVILDLMLPKIDGFNVCRRIRKKNKKTVIIAITGYDSEENKNKILSAGANYFFSKPIDNQGIINIINKMCGVLTQ